MRVLFSMIKLSIKQLRSYNDGNTFSIALRKQEKDGEKVPRGWMDEQHGKWLETTRFPVIQPQQ